MRGHRVWAEIDLSAIRHNVRHVASVVGKNVECLAVVKADAYGHGAVPVAYSSLRAGCRMLGVGDSTEALELRARGILAPILILGAIIEEEIRRVVENRIQVTVHSPDLLPALNREAERQGRILDLHLKIDTGMRRLGISPRAAAQVLEAVHEHPHLRLRGLSTHLSTTAGGNVEYARKQIDIFRATVGRLHCEGRINLDELILHGANSAAIFTLPRSHFDMVRTGIALYGLLPATLAHVQPSLRPALSLKTRVAAFKNVAAGSHVGYDQKYECPAATVLATCPIGYNDGYPYQLTNRGVALVRGVRVPVVGSVTMDYITLDVGKVPGVRVGDEVTLIGRDAGEEVGLSELAALAGTIPYEVTCGLGVRVKRVYLDSEAVAGGEITSGRRIQPSRSPAPPGH